MEGSTERSHSTHSLFKKVDRSYHSTPIGWRLATFMEAIQGLDMIKDANILNKWDRVRLLDGWITGAGYNFEIGNDFKGCLGYMLLTKIEASGFAYADVDLSDSGKEVALFLCVDDWNFEVLYWLLNSWSTSQTMNLTDVTGGSMPLSDAAEFKELNESIGHVARTLADLAGAALERAVNIEYAGADSIQDVLSGMLKSVTQDEQILQSIGHYIINITYFEADEYCLPKSVKPEGVAEAFWSFVCDSFVGYVIELCALRSLEAIRNMKKKGTGGNNFVMATRILLILSDYRRGIIHEPMFHDCSGLCVAMILSYAARKAAGDTHVLSKMLRTNAMWGRYDERGYNVLHKLLTIVVKAKYNKTEKAEKVAGDVVEMLLECGAQPQKLYGIGRYQKKTSLQLVAKFLDEDVGEKLAKALLSKCDVQSIGEFVNARDDEGRSALHRASEKGNASICKLLLESGASLTAQDDNFKMTALHYALQCEQDKVIGVLLKSPLVFESLGLKDHRDRTPLDIAVTNEDYVSIAKLLSKTNEAEAYLNKVNKEKLLRHSILAGSVDIVRKLFEEGVKLPAGDRDDDGRTPLHLAAMCDDDVSSCQISSFLEYEAGKLAPSLIGKMAAIKDRRGRTALHEAALKGHEVFCLKLLRSNPELIYVKDKYGQNSLYDAVRAESTDLFKKLQEAYLKKDRPEDDLVDRSGLTLLHFAASEGKAMHVKELLSSERMKNRYLSRGDMVGQTALHKAAKHGYIDTVEILLKNGAHPLSERDCDGRTALHYAVQAKADIEDKTKLVETLLKPCRDEEKSLLLWASAAGLGTADEKLSPDDSLRQFLSNKKQFYGGFNLLKTAASLGQIQMTKELLSRGYPIEDIVDQEWMESLPEQKKKNVEIVSRQIEMIKERGNDKPAIADSLGRLDYAHGLAALFLNPYIQPPIAVGITGSWGMGKSSVMLQTERILIRTAAYMALLQPSKLSCLASNLPEMKPCKLSRTGKRKWKNICNHIKNRGRNRFVIVWENLKSVVSKPSIDEVRTQLEDFLNNDELKNIEDFKALAAMDSSEMLEKKVPRTKEEDPSGKQNVPAVLTVQFNAWKYKTDTEALAGLAADITRELEGIMTPAQWLNTCWRYNWRNRKYAILFEIFIPFFLAVVLACCIGWIAWTVLGNEKFKKWGEAKYIWPPAAALTILWTLTRKVMGSLKPISGQLMQYVSAPNHTEQLGYQERVISDITLLKAEIGEKPCWLFIVIAWFCSIFSVLFRDRSVGKAMEALKISPASGSHLRIIIFVDDLDRCDESVILQVLSAVNLVLAVCEISVVLGMDKRLIERAILRKHGDQDTGISLIESQKLAEMYLQKIIQLPLDLPDPSDEETRKFLRTQLGVLTQNEDKESLEKDTISSSDKEEGEGGQKNIEVQLDINEQPPSEIKEKERRLERVKTGLRKVRSQINEDESTHPKPRKKNSPFILQKVRSQMNEDESTHPKPREKNSPFILRKEILFVSYSEREEEAFLYFQPLATECRKLPREWKRLLNYHRLVWYIFSVSEQANQLNGWQVQLITWIFVCWEWEENMDFVIKKWKEIVNTPQSKNLSLLIIVEQLMEEHQREMNQNDEETKSSSSEVEEVNEKKKASSKKLVKKKNATAMKLDALVKSVAKLEKEIIELKEVVCNKMEKQIRELQKQVSGDMKKDINELKRQMVGQQNGKTEESMEPEKLKMHNLENWERMRKALERYDVPMNGIQAFQRFRFYCIAGYLPPPS